LFLLATHQSERGQDVGVTSTTGSGASRSDGRPSPIARKAPSGLEPLLAEKTGGERRSTEPTPAAVDELRQELRIVEVHRTRVAIPDFR
jgi:hypothetical protein